MTGTRQPRTAAGRLPDRALVEKYAAEGDRTYGMVAAEDVLVLFHSRDNALADGYERGYRDGRDARGHADAGNVERNHEAAAPQPGERHVHTFPNGDDCQCGKTWADARFAPQPGERERALREALAFIADWAHVLARGDEVYGFAEIERRARAALAHQQPTEGGQE